mmetsp:Transcript_11976/g.24483  ORF Transcript_11976/g.24483 Transcript_11976/m.24483 type:complete len:132 (+) Transcript_11976:228-623(+)|eukprot:CAMPEP_0118645724 /NCGR_PEP_ID=MMETSP0785-20121206/7659_1 /TAXON_ID=91992 /ORGANISM="Bolidomonas pacifica, Strain CCMP 1866" /LENGTH=131 /DNA_ID=CAMNT_0006537637 /DNA_START=195 /DNA_END=590 /DNA_ORIENTATION=-
MSHRILLLHPGSTGGSTAAQAGNTLRCRDLFSAKKIDYLSVDGSDPSFKVTRDSLFATSGVRGNYPQIFKLPVGVDINDLGKGKEGDVEFVGCWDKIESLNELNELPPSVMEAHPEIVTLDMVMDNVVKKV